MKGSKIHVKKAVVEALPGSRRPIFGKIKLQGGRACAGKVAEGSYKRPSGTSAFRWGRYVGGKEVKEDAMIFFSGVTVDGKK